MTSAKTGKRKRAVVDNGASDAALASKKSSQLCPSAHPDNPNDAEDATLSLVELLDLSSVNADDVAGRFDNIAERLLKDFYLSVPNKKAEGLYADYEILEFEFYLWTDGVHEDPFTHGSAEQRTSGQWYFHRAPKRSNHGNGTVASNSTTASGGYRGGTRKGLDLTFGPPCPSSSSPKATTSPYFGPSLTTGQPPPSESPLSTSPPPTSLSCHGGILLRTLRRVSDSKVISGPSVLVDEVLRAHGASSINDLVTTTWGGDISAFSGGLKMTLRPRPLKTRDSTGKDEDIIYKSPRVGLDLSHPSIPLPSATDIAATLTHPRVIYITRPYRYFMHPELLTANGRAQTFLGVMRELGEKKDALMERTNLKEGSVDNWLYEYQQGKRTKNVAEFVGAKGKNVSNSCTKCLRMMGALHSACA